MVVTISVSVGAIVAATVVATVVVCALLVAVVAWLSLDLENAGLKSSRDFYKERYLEYYHEYMGKLRKGV